MLKSATFFRLTGIGIVYLLLLFCMYSLMTYTLPSKVFQKITGGYSYENTGEGTNDIKRIKKKAFVPLHEEGLYAWDAALYQQIANQGYSARDFWLSAFFPLFPAFCNVTHLPITWLPVIHWFLFIVGWAYLIVQFPHVGTTFQRYGLYVLGLSLSSASIFLVPYPEALAFFTFTFALVAMLKHKVWLAAFWLFIFATSRPNSIFVTLALIGALTLVITSGRSSIFKTWYHPILYVLALITGIVAVFSWYYLKTGDFFVFFKAQATWNTQFQWPQGLSDWSSETKALNKLLVFVLVPISTVWLIYHWFSKSWLPKNMADFMMQWCIILGAGTALHVLFFQGGNLHSTHRYMLAQPLFFVALVTGFTYLQNIPLKNKAIVSAGFTLASVLTILISGGTLQPYESAPFWLFIGLLNWLLFMPQTPTRISWFLMGMYVFCAIYYQAFLFNIFLARGWIWA